MQTMENCLTETCTGLGWGHVTGYGRGTWRQKLYCSRHQHPDSNTSLHPVISSKPVNHLQHQFRFLLSPFSRLKTSFSTDCKDYFTKFTGQFATPTILRDVHSWGRREGQGSGWPGNGFVDQSWTSLMRLSATHGRVRRRVGYLRLAGGDSRHWTTRPQGCGCRRECECLVVVPHHPAVTTQTGCVW